MKDQWRINEESMTQVTQWSIEESMKNQWRLQEESRKIQWRRVSNEALNTQWRIIEDSLKNQWRLHEDSMKIPWRLLVNIWQDVCCCVALSQNVFRAVREHMFDNQWMAWWILVVMVKSLALRWMCSSTQECSPWLSSWAAEELQKVLYTCVLMARAFVLMATIVSVIDPWPICQSVRPGWSLQTWLILPVVICLSQRLSHAHVDWVLKQRICERLIKKVLVSSVMNSTWITMVIL